MFVAREIEREREEGQLLRNINGRDATVVSVEFLQFTENFKMFFNNFVGSFFSSCIKSYR